VRVAWLEGVAPALVGSALSNTCRLVLSTKGLRLVRPGSSMHPGMFLPCSLGNETSVDVSWESNDRGTWTRPRELTLAGRQHMPLVTPRTVDLGVAVELLRRQIHITMLLRRPDNSPDRIKSSSRNVGHRKQLPQERELGPVCCGANGKGST
jgi:hypothetical protein